MTTPMRNAPPLPTAPAEQHILAPPEQHPQQQQYQPGALGCGLRLTFWGAAVISLVVWICSLSAAAGDAWLEEEGGISLAAGDRTDLRLCFNHYKSNDIYYTSVDIDALCGFYISFTVFQFLATICCSLAVVAVLVACCRPMVATCMSSITVGFVGGILMGACAIHQAVAFSLAFSFRTTLDTFFGTYREISMGPTFTVAVVASILAFIVSGGLLGCSRHAGDGPIYGICRYHVPMDSEGVGGFSADRVARVTVAQSSRQAPQTQVVATVA